MKMSYTIILLLLTLASASCAVNRTSTSTASPDSIGQSDAAQKWLAADRVLRSASAWAVKSLLPHVLKASEDLNLTAGCMGDLVRFMMAVKKTKLWAFQMLDSFGKIPNALLRGSINALGDYDQCIDTRIPDRTSTGQYCTVEVIGPLPPRQRFVSFNVVVKEFVNITPDDSLMNEMLKYARGFYHTTLRSAVCVPSTCSREEVRQLAAKLLEVLQIDFGVEVSNCETRSKNVVFTSTELAIIAVLCVLLLLAITATVVDIVLSCRLDEKEMRKISVLCKCLLCFSLNRNLGRLLKKDESMDSIKIFHGMKFMAILWVILTHTYIFATHQAMSNILETRNFLSNFFFTIISDGYFSVQVFFFISAVLTAYGTMKYKPKLNIFLYIIRRIWRLAPPFILVIGCIILIPHLGSGPLWKEIIVGYVTERCRKNWWANVLFVNNFLSLNEMCMRWSWYIPVDFQLYLLSLIVLIPLKRNARWGLLANFALFSVSLIVTAALHVHYNLHPFVIPVYEHPDDLDYATDYGYHRTYLHCGTYCVGLTVGYILATKPNFCIPKWVNALGWIAALLLIVGVVYGPQAWMMGDLPSTLVSTLYGTTNKFLFSLSLAWITISCMSGHGGFVTSFLSWGAFTLFGRLTYMMYLVHPLVIFMYIASTKTAIRLDHRTMVFLFLGVIVMTFMVALPLGLLFESPFQALENLLLSRMGVRKHSNESVQDCLPKEETNHNSGKPCTEMERCSVVTHIK